jgi:hypothetical protein
MARRTWLLLAALVALSGCSSLVPGPVAVGAPHDADAEMRPDLIVVDPLQVQPGEVVDLAFPAETTRGVHFVLERLERDAWVHQFDLVSDGPGPDWELGWSFAGAEGFAVEDIGVGGPGPDRVLIPDAAQPGRWRICTGNAAPNICSTLEIVEPDV